MTNSPFLDVDDALLESLLDPSNARVPHGEYGRLFMNFYSSGKKVIEIDLVTPGTPFYNKPANSVAQGFKNALTKANVPPTEIAVKTHTNGSGKPTVYLINAALVRHSNQNQNQQPTDENEDTDPTNEDD